MLHPTLPSATRSSSCHDAGFSLVEVLAGMAFASIGLLGLGALFLADARARRVLR
jgi:Tfp pilus assembly protein PilV